MGTITPVAPFVEEAEAKAPPNVPTGNVDSSVFLKHKRRFCRVEGCGRIVKSQGLCQRHGAKPRTCKVEGCTKQAQGNFDKMCKAHFKAMKRLQTPIPKIVKSDVPPPKKGKSVYEDILPRSISYVPKEGTTMPLVAHLKHGFDNLKPPSWHRNEERAARGIIQIENPAQQLEGWERELVWMEILVLTGVPGASFRHLARAWGRDKGFHMVLAQFICERLGDVERKKRQAETSQRDTSGKKKVVRSKRRKINRSGMDVKPPEIGADVWDSSMYGDLESNEALAAEIFDFTEKEFHKGSAKFKAMPSCGDSETTGSHNVSVMAQAAMTAILGDQKEQQDLPDAAFALATLNQMPARPQHGIKVEDSDLRKEDLGGYGSTSSQPKQQSPATPHTNDDQYLMQLQSHHPSSQPQIALGAADIQNVWNAQQTSQQDSAQQTPQQSVPMGPLEQGRPSGLDVQYAWNGQHTVEQSNTQEQNKSPYVGVHHTYQLGTCVGALEQADAGALSIPYAWDIQLNVQQSSVQQGGYNSTYLTRQTEPQQHIMPNGLDQQGTVDTAIVTMNSHGPQNHSSSTLYGDGIIMSLPGQQEVANVHNNTMGTNHEPSQSLCQFQQSSHVAAQTQQLAIPQQVHLSSATRTHQPMPQQIPPQDPSDANPTSPIRNHVFAAQYNDSEAQYHNKQEIAVQHFANPSQKNGIHHAPQSQFQVALQHQSTQDRYSNLSKTQVMSLSQHQHQTHQDQEICDQVQHNHLQQTEAHCIQKNHGKNQNHVQQQLESQQLPQGKFHFSPDGLVQQQRRVFHDNSQPPSQGTIHQSVFQNQHVHELNQSHVQKTESQLQQQVEQFHAPFLQQQTQQSTQHNGLLLQQHLHPGHVHKQSIQSQETEQPDVTCAHDTSGVHRPQQNHTDSSFQHQVSHDMNQHDLLVEGSQSKCNLQQLQDQRNTTEIQFACASQQSNQVQYHHTSSFEHQEQSHQGLDRGGSNAQGNVLHQQSGHFHRGSTEQQYWRQQQHDNHLQQKGLLQPFHGPGHCTQQETPAQHQGADRQHQEQRQQVRENSSSHSLCIAPPSPQQLGHIQYQVSASQDQHGSYHVQQVGPHTTQASFQQQPLHQEHVQYQSSISEGRHGNMHAQEILQHNVPFIQGSVLQRQHSQFHHHLARHLQGEKQEIVNRASQPSGNGPGQHLQHRAITTSQEQLQDSQQQLYAQALQASQEWQSQQHKNKNGVQQRHHRRQLSQPSYFQQESSKEQQQRSHRRQQSQPAYLHNLLSVEAFAIPAQDLMLRLHQPATASTSQLQQSVSQEGHQENDHLATQQALQQQSHQVTQSQQPHQGVSTFATLDAKADHAQYTRDEDFGQDPLDVHHEMHVAQTNNAAQFIEESNDGTSRRGYSYNYPQ